MSIVREHTGEPPLAHSSHRPPSVGLADALKSHTRPLHCRAERSGILGDLLRGQAGRDAYALLLRNLLPIYEAMERGLDRHRNSPTIAAFAKPEVYRSRAIRADLALLSGPGWESSLSVVPSAARYAGRVVAVAAGGEATLIAHAYVRYLGDLNGGQMLKRILGRTLGLTSESLGFYDFPDITDLALFTRLYRSAFDEAGVLLGAVEPLLAEAEAAFRFNIDLSEEVRRVTA